MTQIQIRRDISANWTKKNPIPAAGEPCFETDTGKFKIGDGTTAYNDLNYQTNTNTDIATTDSVGTVKPDGSTITITSDGTISAASSTPTNMVTTDTEQTISGTKTFSKSITADGIYSSSDITFNGSGAAYINYIDGIGSAYHEARGYLSFAGNTTLQGDTKLTLDGRAGGITLRANSGKEITFSNAASFTKPLYIDGTNIVLSSSSGGRSITTSIDASSLVSTYAAEPETVLYRIETNGKSFAYINNNEIYTKDTDGNLYQYINSQNIDTTYMKWDTTDNKLKVDTAAVAHLAFPSSTSVSLTLGASGSSYTAPADGYVQIGYFGNAGGNFEIIAATSASSVSWVTGAARSTCPVVAGTFSCWYSNIDTSNSGFIFAYNYAVGTVPTA